MKTYKVLEAHQGDKMYLPGDPETGTRIADPNDVEHLVRLGLLEEAGDAPDAPPEPITDPVELRQQVETLTQERDDARRELSVLREEHDATLADLTAARSQIDASTQGDASVSGVQDEQAENPFDHDGDGKPGGSKPRAKAKAS